MAWRNHEDPNIVISNDEHAALDELDQIKYYQIEEENA